MNELQFFNNPEFGNIRMAELEGKPYAVGVDVARGWVYAKPSRAVNDHCKGVLKLGIPSYSQRGAEVIQETNVIPKADIYRLIV
ncbi:MAG TPA: phage antirepressor Ant, partial [Ruminococcaceae bacterium]|nr:phage antirepressor Ant [Oscillospiraceae bacterium]